MVNLDDLTYWQKYVYYLYADNRFEKLSDEEERSLKKFILKYFTTDKIAKKTYYEILHGDRISAITDSDRYPTSIPGLGKVHRLMSNEVKNGKMITTLYNLDDKPYRIYEEKRKKKSIIKRIKRGCKCRR
jgi:hypothetical protein